MGRSLLPKSLPISTSTTIQNANNLSMGPAPYHETYGSGLRVTSRSQIGTITRVYGTSASLVFNGYFGTDAVQCDGIVSSSTSLTYGTNAQFSSGISGAAASFGSNQFGLFDKYNFRKYTLIMVNECALTTRGSVVVVPRFNTHITNRAIGGTPSYNFFSAFPKAVEYGVKTPTVTIPIICDKDMRKPASTLYEVDVETTVDNSLNFQFYVNFASTDIPSSGSETVSRVFAESVIDLYGPHPTVVAAMAYCKKTAPAIAPQVSSSTAQCSASSSSSSVQSRSVESKEAKEIDEEYVKLNFRAGAASKRP